MASRKSQVLKSLEVVLDNALSRLSQLEGKDRIAFASEYQEWLAEDDLKEKVCSRLLLIISQNLSRLIDLKGLYLDKANYLIHK